ncbi:PREDICTED: maltase-glucoamylase, intestinal-like [Priapulus caudatus]|uniref:Maltase-glucoamylase, intestinal-like n=1 Tax=Priapulus caudatus TaxID=37621 RepID=A0ABM1EIZ1_PRICU|nr:PREDICTED: maltase-glucoamylase, intestinal-like [Priapulus caudatus]
MKPSVVAFLVVFLLLLALVVILVPTLYYTLYYKGYATPQCPLANETRGYDDRVDCAPEGDVSEATCVERGCCWHPVNVTGIDARPPPECFFPSNYGYYMVGEPEQTEKGWTATIERLHTPPMFGDETTKLKVEVEMQTKSRLRIKLTDAENHRYEAPLPMVPVEEDFDALDVNSTSEAAYNVTFQSTPFSLKVTRKETGTVIFDTSAGALVFSDYFLQLTTSLPSENVYGVGEHVRGRYRHAAAWKTWTLFSQTSQHAREGANLAGVHPVYMCIEEGGYTHGVFLHNSNAMDVVLQPCPSITYRARSAASLTSTFTSALHPSRSTSSTARP